MFHRSIAVTLMRQGRGFSSSSVRHVDFTHAIIGAGAVGLAIARRLQQVDGARVVLIEKHGMVGSETSSRNSEVIHGALFYGHDSLKTKLCLRGKHMMYELCRQHDIPHKNCGKWVVAQNDEQMQALQKTYNFAKSMDIPIRFVPQEEAQRREPEVRAEAGVLESPTTGIVDSHAYMQFLQGEFENSGGDLALANTVTHIDPPHASHGDWRIYTADSSAAQTAASPTPQTPETSGRLGENAFITAETLINSAGLYACAINNMVLPIDRHRTPFYAKGSYYSYGKSSPKPSTLVYPAPVPGHGGLGTHLTVDMAGRVKFGPDLEWVDSAEDLIPNGNPERLQAALEDIKSYLPNIDADAIVLDYAGIRPKLGRSSATSGSKDFQDFYIKSEEGFPGFINLLAIESPGLTSSPGIAEYVHDLLYK